MHICTGTLTCEYSWEFAPCILSMFAWTGSSTTSLLAKSLLKETKVHGKTKAADVLSTLWECLVLSRCKTSSTSGAGLHLDNFENGTGYETMLKEFLIWKFQSIYRLRIPVQNFRLARLGETTETWNYLMVGVTLDQWHRPNLWRMCNHQDVSPAVFESARQLLGKQVPAITVLNSLR